MKRFFVTLVLMILPLQLGFLYLNNPITTSGVVAGIKTQESGPILNSISIGDFHFTLFGYTSPHAEVTFDGQGIYDKAYADENGYFSFDNRFSPFSPHEACLSSKDQFGRISSPVCLSAFPVKYNVSIGPVLIPPTLSLNQEYYYTNDQITLSGQTIPDSEVDFSVFTKDGNGKLGMETGQENGKWKMVKSLSSTNQLPNPLLFLSSIFIKPVEAFSFPELTARSDSKGNYSLSLPSSNPETFRLFTQTKFNDSMSPTSIKLNFKVMPVWMIIIQFFTSILLLLKGRWLELTIIGEILVVLYFILPLIFHHKNLAIILRKDDLPAVLEQYPLTTK